MRIPYEWLNEIIALDRPVEEVAEKLTMIGLEVEALELIDGDTVLEVNVTPNRPDCLSIVGIARELSAAYRIPLTLPEHTVVGEAGALDFNVDILDKNLCNRYAGRIVKGITVGPSPVWMRARLEKCGVRSINNIVDITNYVLLEFGHPLHAFDLKTLKGHKIQVATPTTLRGKEAKVTIKTLDGVERKIPRESLLIWDAEDPIAVAGVMGGQDTEVGTFTTDVFVESAYFDPVSIRRTSKALGLKTEASYRFERGTDIKMLKKALDRAVYLVKELAGGTIYGKIDIYPKRHAPVSVVVEYKKVNKVLGLKLTKQEIIRTIEGLGFTIEAEQDRFTVKVPPFRKDVKRDADIIEEVARMYGYNNIPAELPRATLGIEEGGTPKLLLERFKRELKETFLKSGYSEVINYSFMNASDLDLLKISQDDRRRNLVQIRNPLRIEDSFMRTTIIPSLLKNLTHNVAHGNRELMLFETGRVFFKKEQDTLPDEEQRAAALYFREKGKSLYKEAAQEFYIIKGILEALFNDLKIRDYSFVRSSEPFLHPGQSADIMIAGMKAGFIGALSPAVMGSLDIKASKPTLIILELFIDAIAPHTIQLIKYRPLPKFPFVERDTALIVESGLEAAKVMDYVRSFQTDLIEDVAIFDLYEGENIPQGKKSIAFTVRYRAKDRTLTDEEVDKLHTALVDFVLSKTHGELRK